MSIRTVCYGVVYRSIHPGEKAISINGLSRILICSVTFTAIAFAQLSDRQISGGSADTHWGVIYLTHDDAMEEPMLFGGLYNTKLIVALLQNYGFADTFFMVGCHIYGQPLSLPGSSLCGQGLGDVPVSVVQEVADAGFLIANHTFSHLGLSHLQAQDMFEDIRTNQALVDSLHQKLGLKILRCPGLDCGNVTWLNSQPDLAKLRGPINADVGAGFVPDSIMPVPGGIPDAAGEGGDWWFYQNGLSAQFAGYYYVRDISEVGARHGAIVLLHTRTEAMTGSDGSRGFPVQLLQYIIDNVPAGFTFAPLDGIPGLLGNMHTTRPEQIGREFGSGDGQGRVVAGRVTGARRQEVCKARELSVRCMTWHKATGAPGETVLELGASTSWRDIGDANWSALYGSRFWLVDLNGDGRDDLVIPGSSGLTVSYSDGVRGFSAPSALLTANNLDYRALRFADVNGDGLADVVAWIAGTVYVYLNNGRGFNPPVAASTDFPAAGFGDERYLSAMQVADINGDGCDDLIFRGPADVFVSLSDCHGKFLPAKSWSRKFSDRQNFSMASQNLTFSAVQIAGQAGLAAGLFTGGVVFQESDAANGRFGQYRYIMDNFGFSGDPAFHPEAYASDVIFTDLFGNGDTIPVQVRANGLYASRIRVTKDN
ncbi:MAG TPA: FG-GAP-like repeat-containing protein [Bryobacteraceae bacterium]|nr:FG-GAP-like repeat-containing protein [Bryobacteraceae bacterium]